MAGEDQCESPTVESEEQFWQGLEDIFSSECAGNSHEAIDDALRSWLYLVASCRDRYLTTEVDVASCSRMLVRSKVFSQNREYVRTQIIYSLLQEDEAGPLHAIANFLLLDGRSDETSFRRMIDEGCFPRLLELINGTRDRDRRLHRLLLDLIYEMSRIERVRPEDLLQVTDGFVEYMFQVIESLSDDAADPYHYPIIRVLLVLNEQFLLASTAAAVNPTLGETPITNRVIKVLSLRGTTDFRAFGENIILLLNRETETSLQLLILKLLYLLFTTRATYEYFYTNDLRVLLDVIIRNLLDLPNDSSALRHTYLRVLYPLLAHTQLSHPPHYKREELTRLLRILAGEAETSAHFDPADETTVRLVERVAKVGWLGIELPQPQQQKQQQQQQTQIPPDEGEVARKLLGISLSDSQAASCASVVDVAAVMEKPGVKTPSRRAEQPPPPQPRIPQQQLQVVQQELLINDGQQQQHVDEDEDVLQLKISVTKTSTAAIGVKPPSPKSAAPAAATLKPRRVRPEVPKHRHGKLLTPPPPPQTQTQTHPPPALHVNGSLLAVPGGAASPVASIPGTPGTPGTPGSVTSVTSSVNGGGGQKKMPPKAPPPRRGGTRLRQAASATNLRAVSVSASVPVPAPVPTSMPAPVPPAPPPPPPAAAVESTPVS